jgi:hypothetical protein
MSAASAQIRYLIVHLPGSRRNDSKSFNWLWAGNGSESVAIVAIEAIAR